VPAGSGTRPTKKERVVFVSWDSRVAVGIIGSDTRLRNAIADHVSEFFCPKEIQRPQPEAVLTACGKGHSEFPFCLRDALSPASGNAMGWDEGFPCDLPAGVIGMAVKMENHRKQEGIRNTECSRAGAATNIGVPGLVLHSFQVRFKPGCAAIVHASRVGWRTPFFIL
jgi:hypothetical protein